MQFLAQFLLQAVNALLTYLASRFTKKIGMAIFTITVVVTLSLSLFLLLKSLVFGLEYFITDKYVLMVMTALWPSNAEACVTAILTADLAVYIFRFKRKIYWGTVH